MKKLFSAIGKILGGLVKFLQAALLLFFIVIWVIALSGNRVEVPESGALILAPSGVLVEQIEGSVADRAFARWQGMDQTQTLVQNVTDSLKVAANDDRIKAVVLDLRGLQGGGVTKLQVVAEALELVREAGKPIIAMADGYTQPQYYLAAHADEVYMHELGFVYIDGFGSFRSYFKDVLEKLYIDVNVFRVGEYKSFVEPFLRNDMSEEDKVATRQWLDALWLEFSSDIEYARELPEGSLNAYANNAAVLLEAAGGDTAVMAVEQGLVDGLMTHQSFEDYIAGMVGYSDEVAGLYEGIHFEDYLAAVGRPGAADEFEQNVAVLVASGNIVDGEAAPGTVGGNTLAGLIREATYDDTVQAVVLQVDSPGGSMFASQVVLDQIEVLQESGKTFVVSMSSVAASGGYYIAMSADEIWASTATISGSIGVGAIIPTFQRTLNEAGINIDGFGTTKMSGQLDPLRELGPDAKELLQTGVDQAYQVFIAKVAAARGMEVSRVDDIARGRVWIGSDAQELGLVDYTGTLDDAVASAAELAGIDDDYGVRYFDQELTPAELFLMQLAGGGAKIMSVLGLSTSESHLNGAMKLFEAQLREFSLWNDPRGIYFHCDCVL